MMKQHNHIDVFLLDWVTFTHHFSLIFPFDDALSAWSFFPLREERRAIVSVIVIALSLILHDTEPEIRSYSALELFELFLHLYLLSEKPSRSV
jgi:hypothetical protein